MGDEFFHYWETKDGRIVSQQADGSFVVTNEASPDEEQVAARRRASRMYQARVRKVGASSMPARGLFILVSFNDKAFKSSSETYYKTKLGDATEGAMSMYNYLKEQSNGAYAPPIDVYGPVTLSHNVEYYGGNNSSGDDQRPASMIKEACQLLDATINFSQYDNNNDGVIDNVYVIYAGKGEADGGADETIWPHQWDIYSAEGLSCTLDGKSLKTYACSAELNGDGNCAMGTPLHEFSHVLGLPDYYVTSKTATNYPYDYTPGAWSLMDYGSYNDNGNTPPNYSVYDKYYLGWATPTLLKQNEAKNVTVTTAHNSIYQITGNTSSAAATSTNRVWYLENRQKTGWDAYLPGHGLCVWEVLYSSTAWNNNNLNNSSVRYTIVTANNLTRPYEPCVYSTTASSTSGTPFPGTSHITSYTPATGCALTEITESSGTITFKYNGGEDKTRANYEFVTDHCSAPADGDVAINAALSVTITPNSGYTLDDASCWTVEMGGVTLTYGSGFTYNASTNTFYIASLTDDVVIMAEAKLIRTVTWSVQGNTSTTTFADGAALVLPSTPADCSGESGKKFVGWTASSSVSGSAPADLFTEASGTVNADATYYAVYATAGSGGGDPITVVERMSTSGSYVGQTGWTASAGGTYTTSGNYGDSSPSIKFSSTGHYVQSATFSGAITAVSYWYKPQNATGSLSFYVSTDGSSFSEITGEKVTFSSSSTSGTKSITLNAGNNYKAIKIVYTKTTSNVAVDDISVTYGGGGSSYSDYSLTCGTPCSNTPIMSFSPETVNKTTADASFTKEVSISGKGSGQTVYYGSSDESVATVNNSGVVTLKGKVGSTIITASVDASGTYCAASASYTLNVTAAPIDVTLYYNGTSASLTNQASPYTLPTGAPYNTAMCDGNWTFAGWFSSAYSKSTSAPAYITELTATGSAYAVYTTTETSGGGGDPVTVVERMSTSGSYVGQTGWTASAGGTYTTSGNYGDSSPSIKFSSTGHYVQSATFSGAITAVSYWYKPQNATGSLSFYVSTDGSSFLEITGEKVTFSSSSTSGTKSITLDAGNNYKAIKIVYTKTTSNVAVDDISVTYGGGGSSTTYYATTPDCSTATTYTVTWKACGETFKSETYAEGAALVLPASNPADNAGKTFVGWTATEHHTGASAPADLFNTAGSKTVTADVTYYAVFH